MKLTKAYSDSIRLLTRVAPMYWDACAGFRKKKQFYDARTNWVTSLKLFLHCYAFQRSVFISQYAEAAKKAVEELLYVNTTITKGLINKVAQRNDKIVSEGKKRIKVNQSHNPLAPNGSVLSLCNEIPHKNLLAWTLDSLHRGNIQEVADGLCSVRGIGYKIAAFWIRDVAEAFNVSLKKLEEPSYSQPIDVWVYRFIRAVARTARTNLPRDLAFYTKKSYWAAAELMIEAADQAGVRHTALNQAVWYYSSEWISEWSDFGAAELDIEGEIKWDKLFSTPRALQANLKKVGDFCKTHKKEYSWAASWGKVVGRT